VRLGIVVARIVGYRYARGTLSGWQILLGRKGHIEKGENHGIVCFFRSRCGGRAAQRRGGDHEAGGR